MEIADFNGHVKDEFKREVLSKKLYEEELDEFSELSDPMDLPIGRLMLNIVAYTLISVAQQWSLFLLNYMNKDFEGNIFEIYYLEGAAAIIGILAARPIPSRVGIRWAYFITFSISCVFNFIFYLHEAEHVDLHWIEYFGYPSSPYTPGSEEDLYHYKKAIIPVLVFFVKIPIFMSLNMIINENLLFPVASRTTLVGACSFVAGLVTTTAPLVAELERPWQSWILLLVGIGALLSSLALPGLRQEEEQNQRLEAFNQRVQDKYQELNNRKTQ